MLFCFLSFCTWTLRTFRVSPFYSTRSARLFLFLGIVLLEIILSISGILSCKGIVTILRTITGKMSRLVTLEADYSRWHIPRRSIIIVIIFPRIIALFVFLRTIGSEMTLLPTNKASKLSHWGGICGLNLRLIFLLGALSGNVTWLFAVITH